MRTEERIVNEVATVLGRETSVNLHRFPLHLEFAGSFFGSTGL